MNDHMSDHAYAKYIDKLINQRRATIEAVDGHTKEFAICRLADLGEDFLFPIKEPASPKTQQQWVFDWIDRKTTLTEPESAAYEALRGERELSKRGRPSRPDIAP